MADDKGRFIGFLGIGRQFVVIRDALAATEPNIADCEAILGHGAAGAVKITDKHSFLLWHQPEYRYEVFY